MPKRQTSSQPPPIIPGLKLVSTGETFVENGKRYVIVKLEREQRSDVSYSIKPKRNYAT